MEVNGRGVFLVVFFGSYVGDYLAGASQYNEELFVFAVFNALFAGVGLAMAKSALAIVRPSSSDRR